MTRHRINGQVILGSELPSCTDAPIHVYIEDIGRAGAPARLIARHTIPSASHEVGRQDAMPFSFDFDTHPDPHAVYAVRAHVDTHGDGEIHQGDFISMESYPFELSRSDQPLVIKVREVT